MATDNDDAIDTLNDLIETCKDGEDGFRQCAERAPASPNRAFFETGARRCGESAAELQALVRQLGGDPEKRGSVIAAVHRGWLNIKTALTSNDEKPVIDECERGEDVAMKSYQEALEKVLPDNVRAVVARQFLGVQENHERARQLKHSTP